MESCHSHTTPLKTTSSPKRKFHSTVMMNQICSWNGRRWMSDTDLHDWSDFRARVFLHPDAKASQILLNELEHQRVLPAFQQRK